MKKIFILLSIVLFSFNLCAQQDYMISSSLWEGEKWNRNQASGTWFPLIDTVAHFGIDNYSWGQVRTKATLPFGTTMQIDVRIYLNSGGENGNMAFFGYGDEWIYYTGRFYGVKFFGGEVHLWQIDSSLVQTDEGKIGTYTAGERITFTISLTEDGIIRVVGDKFAGSFTPNTSLTSSFRCVMADANNSPDTGFLVSSVIKTSATPSTKTVGVTIIAHGYNLPEPQPDPINYWTEDFIISLLKAYGGGKVFVYQPADGRIIWDQRNSFLATGIYKNSGECIILMDWLMSSNDNASGQAEAAADAFFASIIAPDGDGIADPIFIDPIYPAKSKPIHLIGHSRGCPVISELAQRFGRYGIIVNYVTYLDPHDFNEWDVPFDGYFHDPAVQIWSNIKYAENYYQVLNYDTTWKPLGPSGRRLPQITEPKNNLCLTAIDDYDKRLYTHGDVKQWYLGTIDRTKFESKYYPYGHENYGFRRWLNLGGYDYTGNASGIQDPTHPITLINLKPYPDINDGDQDSASTLFYNGDFSLKDLVWTSMAGWSNHGGRFYGHLGKNCIYINCDTNCVEHNRFYIPISATKISFRYRRTGSSQDTLRISMLTSNGAYKIKKEITTDQIPTEFTESNIPVVDEKNCVSTIKFELMRGSNIFANTEVWIDDILLVVEDVPVPVELEAFYSNRVKDGITLNWKTACELNNAGFDVERRSVSKVNIPGSWGRIGFVAGKGTSNSPNLYSFFDGSPRGGDYSYRLKQIDRDGKYKYSKSIDVTIALKTEDYTLSQNFPNPFNPVTEISFAVHTAERVMIKVFNLLGQDVGTLFNQTAVADTPYRISFNAKHLPSGVYFYTLWTRDRYEIKKMIVAK